MDGADLVVFPPCFVCFCSCAVYTLQRCNMFAMPFRLIVLSYFSAVECRKSVSIFFVVICLFVCFFFPPSFLAIPIRKPQVSLPVFSARSVRRWHGHFYSGCACVYVCVCLFVFTATEVIFTVNVPELESWHYGLFWKRGENVWLNEWNEKELRLQWLRLLILDNHGVWQVWVVKQFHPAGSWWCSTVG